MGLLILAALFFTWLMIACIFSQMPFTRYDFVYVVILLGLIFFCVKLPYQHWAFEQLLTKKAAEVSGNVLAKVQCTTVFESIYEDEVFNIGHANLQTGQIVLQHSWCDALRDHLAQPRNPTRKELTSLHLFTHEVMHLRGELDEQKTDCQAVQRNARMAKLFGVPDVIAEENAVAYYKKFYALHNYFSVGCAPGKKLDERLADSTWRYLPARR